MGSSIDEEEEVEEEEEEEEEEEDYEDGGRGNRFLGFMFGNVDNSGDLDVDYLDEDAKEHLAALADKLGSSLTEIDLSVKSPQLSADAAEQDYDEKADDAVDYEDIDEQYEGPEVQAAGEEDHLLPKKDYFSSQVSVGQLDTAPFPFDDENYDEIEEEEVAKEDLVMDKLEIHDISLSGQQDVAAVSSDQQILSDGVQPGSVIEQIDSDLEGLWKEEVDALEGPVNGKDSSPLPVLCIEDGLVILRFSEIFGMHEPVKKDRKRDHRYSVLRDKYRNMDIVEEDEKAFMKSSSQVISFRPHISQQPTTVSYDTGSESVAFGSGEGDIEMSVQSKEQRQNCCSSSEPFNMDLIVDLAEELQPELSTKFHPLDQQDWEDRIVWENSPAVSGNSMECYDIAPGSTISSIKQTDVGSGPPDFRVELLTNSDKKDYQSFVHSSSVVGSFSEDSSNPQKISSSEQTFHPQLLRLESRPEVDQSDLVDNREKVAIEPCKSDALRRFDKLTLRNGNLMEGYWLDDIVWEPNSVMVKPKLILDLQDEQMLFELLDHEESELLQLRAGAMIVSHSPTPTVSLETLGDGYKKGWQFNIANDKFYVNGNVSRQLQSSSSKRTTYGIKVHHSAAAIKLETTKLKLSNKDLANFHRPRAMWYPHSNGVAVKEQWKLPTLGSMKIILKSLGGKGSKLHVDADETVSSVKVKASKKLDFKLSEVVKLYYLGKELEDSKSLAAQNVQPNSLLHLVRTKVHLMPRAQKIPRDNKSLRPPGAFKKKSDLSVRDGHVYLMEYCEERPLLLSNAGMGANLCTYYQKSSPSDQTGVLLHSGTSLGNVTMLEPSDKSPFLGDIRPGCSQSAIETNMYKAPVFPHKVPYTDYLLVRSAKGKLSIRRIDRIAVVGQQEPLMEVFSPGSKNLQAYMINRLLVYVYREFRAAEKRGVVPWIRADELSSLFPNLSDTILRKKLKECAVLRKDANGHLFWSKKRDFSIPSEDDLKKLVSPENVCSYESMQAGVYHLKHLGITRLTLPTGVSNAMSQLPDEAIALAAASHIERELQITPWSLSGNFVTSLNQDRENIERLEITGVGDPSGRGLGFSYVRSAPKAPISATAKKKAAAGRGGTTVTGTDADLRRLSMEAAREVLLKFNIPEEQIAKMTRWHRIAMIRKLSSEQAASGVKVDPTTISKYARGQRMSFLQLQQQTREKCQEIWDRQMQSLSAVDGDNESDTEENSDLDSFAGDLENLLDAEECEGDGGNNESKHEKSGGVRGLKMRRRPSQTQAEEEIEDEAAEAAELCRLLMDDDVTEQKKKKAKAPAKVPVVEAKLAPGSKSNFVDSTEQVKKSNKFQPNGSYTPNDNATGDLEEGESSFGKRKISDKTKTTKNKDSSSTTQIKARVKILGDGPQIFKEKKSSRESFVCGACHQPGHMRTNKNCPKYREDSETHIEAIDIEKAPVTSNPVDPPSLSQQKVPKKRSVIKSTTKIEPAESEKSTMKGKMIPVKIKCGSTENFSDKPPADGTALSSEAPSTSEVRLPETDSEAGSKSRAKVNKIIISNKGKAEDVQVESRRPSVVIRPPAEADRNQVESQKASIVIRPPTNIDKDLAQSHKPSIVIRPPAEKDREHAHKKIVIKRTKEITDLDQVSQDGSPDFEYRKTKKIVDLSSSEKLGKQEATSFTGVWSKKRSREERRWWEEEKKRRASDRLREDKVRIYEDKFAILEEQDRFAEVRRFEKGIWRDKDEERQKAKTKKKKKKKHVFTDDYLEDYREGRNNKRMRESDRGAKRQPIVELGRYGTENAPVTKRRRGGEVGLANILERIVDTLRNQGEVSWLFLQPVKKKEAPDYYNIIKQPMDLSTIRDKVRKMEYKNREEFRHDVCQITINAHIYNNGKNPSIPPLADQLLEICDFLLKEHEESLMEAENSIEP